MKYNETFYIVLRGEKPTISQVSGATYKLNPRLFIYKHSDRFVLTDKDTGLCLCGATTLKDLDKLYNHNVEAMYNKAIANAKIYKEAVNQLKQLRKEHLIRGLL